ncbi:hypothetical protein [Belliella aquatica]|uniref:Uncharacterized protein n=1 Tax=Belliella aquatica TaxID=1323734 RepID=A0ABQ1M221_9BACT|nr:hypothetical protein [Belliella aquatica]MCH7406831.1 hypothetical protein [Belliella aquatica]GGC32383.1 hypothetical protein GCM10010993_09200 [Belliella aquatica]
MKARYSINYLFTKTPIRGLGGVDLFALSSFSPVKDNYQSDKAVNSKLLINYGLSAFEILFERKPKNPI